jgi:hypothetical protein
MNVIARILIGLFLFCMLGVLLLGIIEVNILGRFTW